jgi:hypothetical protein
MSDRNRNVIALSFVVVLAGACSPTTPSSASMCVSKSAMSAIVDGTPWTACVVVAVNQFDLVGYFRIEGTDDKGQGIALSVSGNRPGMYALSGVATQTTAGLYSDCRPRAEGCKLWLDNRSGLIVVTDVTATHASGTFSFNLVSFPSSGATGTKVVSGGTFDVFF